MRSAMTALAVSLLLSAGCGTGDDLLSIPDDPVSGRVNGREFVYRSGETSINIGSGRKMLIFNNVAGECEGPTPGLKVSVYVPDFIVGRWELADLGAVFTDLAAARLRTCTEGIVEITSAADGILRGGVVVRCSSDDWSAAGTFELAVCP